MRLTRVAGATGCAVVSACCVVAVIASVVSPRLGWPWAVLFGAATALLLAFAARSARVAVVLGPDRVLVRGALWDRSIPRGAVRSVHDLASFPTIHWTAPAGRHRVTPVQAMNHGSNVLRVFRDHAREGVDMLQRWADGS